MAVDSVCTRCGNKAPGVRELRGNVHTELWLWMALVVPGVIYTAWRHAARVTRCRRCGGTDLVPETSPEGRRILTLMDAEGFLWPLRRLEATAAAPEPPARTKQCPDCAEPIRLEARVCRYCGRRFDEEEIARANERARALPTVAAVPATWRGRRCPICDTQNGPEVGRCRHCGEEIGSVPVTAEW